MVFRGERKAHKETLEKGWWDHKLNPKTRQYSWRNMPVNLQVEGPSLKGYVITL